MIFGEIVIVFMKSISVLLGAAFNKDGDAHNVSIRGITFDGSTDCNKDGDEDNPARKLNTSGGDIDDSIYGEVKIVFTNDTVIGVEGEDIEPVADSEAISDGDRPQYEDSLKVDAYLEGGISSVTLSQLKP